MHGIEMFPQIESPPKVVRSFMLLNRGQVQFQAAASRAIQLL